MKLTKCKKYKNLGITWLGTIPEHWETKRNKNIFFEVSQLSDSGEETLLTVSHITGVTPRTEKNVNMFLSETMEGYKICKKGDLIINTMWAWMGALGVSKHYGICSPAYNVYRHAKGTAYNPEYFDYLFRIPNSIMEMTRYSKGIVSSRLRLYPKDFFQIISPVPPYEEQQSISKFLDKKTASIDKKIALLQSKITYYKELSKSLINEAVCGRLNIEPQTRNHGNHRNQKKHNSDKLLTKESSVEWIGKIPENWEVKRLKDYFILFTGNSISDKNLFENKINSMDYVSTKDINGDTGQINYDNGTYVPLNDKTFKISKPNSTLICIEGANAGKKIGFNTKAICFVNKLCSIKSIDKNNFDKYFYYYSQSKIFENQFFSIINGLIGGVSINSLKYFIFPIPPLTEQIAIANYLDNKTNTINAIVKNINLQIETLKELRKTLINDVVTGKLKIVET